MEHIEARGEQSRLEVQATRLNGELTRLTERLSSLEQARATERASAVAIRNVIGTFGGVIAIQLLRKGLGHIGADTSTVNLVIGLTSVCIGVWLVRRLV